MVGLAPPNKVPSSPKSEYETLQISGDFIEFSISSPPGTNVKPRHMNVKPPSEDFLATVLSASLPFKQPWWLSTSVHNQASMNIIEWTAAEQKDTEVQRMSEITEIVEINFHLNQAECCSLQNVCSSFYLLQLSNCYHSVVN